MSHFPRKSQFCQGKRYAMSNEGKVDTVILVKERSWRRSCEQVEKLLLRCDLCEGDISGLGFVPCPQGICIVLHNANQEKITF